MTSETSPSAHHRPTRRDEFVERVAHILATLSGVLLVTLFLVNVTQVFARPVMGGWIWVSDFSRLLIVWVIMLGAAAASGLREHLLVDFVRDRVPPAFQVASAYFVRLCELGIGIILLVSGSVVAMSRMNIQYIQLGLPTGYAYLAVPVLGFFMVVFGALMSVRRSGAGHSATSEAGEFS